MGPESSQTTPNHAARTHEKEEPLVFVILGCVWFHGWGVDIHERGLFGWVDRSILDIQNMECSHKILDIVATKKRRTSSSTVAWHGSR